MALVLNEEQVMLRDSARSFFAELAPVSQLRALRDQRDDAGFSHSLWKRIGEMGFTGILVPESLGGLGLGHVEAGIVMQEIGRHLVATPLLSSSIVGATAIGAGGTQAQREELLRDVATGKRLATLAVDEQGRHRPERVTLRARRSGAQWVLDGAKTFVLDGHVADVLLVVARTSGGDEDAQGVSLFAVDRSSPGVTVERTVMVDAHNAARIGFAAVELPDTALLGEAGRGRVALDAALAAGRTAAAAELLGAAEEAFERTLRYLRERRQFGKLIGEFQALQHRAAHLYSELELARAAVMHAQQALDARDPQGHAAASLAKAKAGHAAMLAVQEGVQMHGGIGMTDEFDMGLFMKRARVLEALFGDADFHADRLARGRGY